MSDLIKFINETLYLNDTKISKRCCESWFTKNNLLDKYKLIIDNTNFLDPHAKFSERLFCIKNEIKTKQICSICLHTPVKFGIAEYRKYCSSKCAQSNNLTIEKIKLTRLKKYGSEFPNSFSSDRFKNNILENYGVDNISKLDSIKLKKETTCLDNFGTKYPQQNLLIRKKSIATNLLKYGVDNVRKNKDIIEKGNATRRVLVYNILKNKFKDSIEFLFNEQEYNNTGTVYNFKCLECDHIFNSTLKNGRIPRCLLCYPYISGSSNMEKELVLYIKSLGIENIIENTKSVIYPLELDIYLPDHNIAIEFNGIYWHSELGGNTPKEYHLNKTIKCADQGIKLIHIFEDEWLNKKDIIKSIIKSNLKLNDIKIPARKCDIKMVTSTESNKFYNSNHIQGGLNSTINIGLFYENELISLISFSKPRSIYGNLSKQYEYELTRFCSKIGYTVQGGASKLFSHFIQSYTPNSIITYSDICKTGLIHSSNIYNKLGFQFINRTTPNYWYIINGNKEYRYKYQKRNLSKLLEKYDSELTEWQNMQLNKYDRIWDCGNLKFEYIGK